MIHNKKYILLAMAVGLMAVTGCKKEEESGEKVPVTFTVNMESHPGNDAKVHLDASWKPCWDDNDQIQINDGVGTVTPNADNATRGTFTAEISGSSYSAVYPAGLVSGTVTSTPTIALPRVQIYETVTETVEGVSTTRQKIFAPMAAYNAQNPVLEFKNLCGLLEIEVTNDKAWDMVLDSIHVEAASASVCGDYTFDISGATPSVTSTANGKMIVSLARSGDASIGERINSNQTSSVAAPTSDPSSRKYYVTLPPNTPISGLTIRVFSHPVWETTGDGDGEVHIVYARTSSNSVAGDVLRNEIVPVPFSPADCGLLGTTFTSMKAFSTMRSDANYQLCFSRGNVQYYCSGSGNGDGLGRKRLAPRQWMFVDKDDMYSDADYTGWIDHFCWATGANFQHHTGAEGDYDNGNNHLYGSDAYVQKDWGYHFTNRTTGNPATVDRIWHTPSKQEIGHIFPWDGDPLLITAAGAAARTYEDSTNRFAWVGLTGIKDVDGNAKSGTLYGIVLFPDAVRGQITTSSCAFNSQAGAVRLGYDNNPFKLRGTNGEKKYDDNILTVSQFEYLEAKGCIFLPCLGTYLRHSSLGNGNDLWDKYILATNGPEGTYWTSTFHNSNSAFVLKIKAGGDNLSTAGGDNLFTYVYPTSDVVDAHKCSVRLVCPYGTAYKWDPDQM